MNQYEIDARELTEQIRKLPNDIQERLGYIIQGALLVSGSCVDHKSN